ncbi:MotA/TolQ/ExbB proton channel family protein [Aquimarina sp. MAR_2010_214]|uniref:MotA/TolQ/ExbB proton channel family protein n=1 Tax=Aquimarina sp. MAR_2010_214 TaxID=1250026 RepID=UPI000C70EA97|nr:MotA/TolQ/ExbB proton channel family protein [Aquimarina sp. MAR_2010_214]PKV52072.1 MotA/TolQ/ExbB proton channel family protein [Aquimarina sp. MAR_2010_214]
MLYRIVISLVFIQSQNHSFFAHIVHLLKDGGFFFMLPILMMFFVVLSLVIKNVIVFRKEKILSKKHIQLINSIGLLTLVWGVLGQLLGLVGALDNIDMFGEPSIEILATGLKMSTLPTIFGCFVFVVSRGATIIFTWINKEIE